MKTSLRVLSLLSVAALLAVSGCKKAAPERDLCAEFFTKAAKCQGVDAGDPRIKQVIAECQEYRKELAKEDPERLKAEDANALKLIDAKGCDPDE